MAFKTFVNGTNLPASDLNDYLMKQSVMTFASSAARASALTVPVEGMLTYLSDTDRFAFWNGSAWVGPYGLNLTKRVTITASNSTVINDAFSTAYDFYRIVIHGYTSTVADLLFRLTAAGSESATSYYAQRAYAISTTSAADLISNGAYFPIMANAGNPGAIAIEVGNPASTSLTSLSSNGGSAAGGAALWNVAGFHNAGTAYDGFKLYTTTGTFTGTVRVYGYRNA